MQPRPATGARGGRSEHQQCGSSACMPQVKLAPQCEQRDSGGGFFAFIQGKPVHGRAQEPELCAHIAAALADDEVHAQRDPLAEAELAVCGL